jgi:hypothetical protein
VKSNEASSTSVPITSLLSSLTITTASSIRNNIDQKVLLRKKLINNENISDNNQEALIENYVSKKIFKVKY